jgi:hypothetical protein
MVSGERLTMGLLARRKETPVVIKDLGDGQAIVVSSSRVIDALGEPLEAIPSSFIRALE